MRSAPGALLYLAVPHLLRLGPLRLTLYGACAALGVVLAMAVSGRAARRLGIRSETAWDAGLFAVVSCFVASRLLLVLRDVKTFSRYPLLVLSLPSLTLGGLLLAGLITLLWARWKRLPVLELLDAFAPGGALLAAFLELGHWLDGSEPGMPLRWRWSGVDLAARGLRLHPVSLYGIVLSLALSAILWGRLAHLRRSGRVTALALMAGGILAFALSLLTLPTEVEGWALEPGQITALAVLLAGGLLWSLAPRAFHPDSGVANLPRSPASVSLETEER